MSIVETPIQRSVWEHYVLAQKVLCQVFMQISCEASNMATNFAALAMGYVMFGVLFVYSLFFQRAWSDTATVAGYRLLPLAIAFILTGPLADRLGARRRPRASAAAGLVILGGACLILARLPNDVPYGIIATVFAVLGLGYGLLATTLAIAAIGALPPHQQGIASALNNTARQFGGVLGVAVAGQQVIFTRAATTVPNPVSVALFTFAVWALLAVIVLGVSAIMTHRNNK